MKLRHMLPFRVVVSIFLFLTAVQAQVDGLSQLYCSPLNTASNYAAVNYQYQSNGACKTQCQNNYAFGIVQDKNCWCTNYVPGIQVPVSYCNSTCPGYPDDLCGNLNNGYYGYVYLGSLSPSGTSGGITTTSSTSTLTQATTSTTSSSSSSSNSPSITPSSSDVDASNPIVSTQIIQLSGAVITQTVTTTPSSTSLSQAENAAYESQQKSGLSGGAIAGIVIGVLAGLALLVAGAFFFWRRRRQAEQDKADAMFAAAGAGMNEKGKRSPRRNVSVLSKSGLIGGVGLRDSSGDKDYDEPINTGTSSQRHSMLFGAGANGDGVSPVSPLEHTNSNDSRRHSRPLVYDQRLNPSALFASHDNGSRVSMQDGADYSRTLGVTNPDPRVSFESRISRQG